MANTPQPTFVVNELDDAIIASAQEKIDAARKGDVTERPLPPFLQRLVDEFRAEIALAVARREVRRG